MQRRFVASMVAVSLLAGTGVSIAAGDAEKCAGAKMKTAGKYVGCRLGADAKAAATGNPADYAKCDAVQAAAWAKLETKYGADCPTSGDQSDVQTDLADVTSCVSGDLAGATGTCHVSTTAVLPGERRRPPRRVLGARRSRTLVHQCVPRRRTPL